MRMITQLDDLSETSYCIHGHGVDMECPICGKLQFPGHDSLLGFVRRWPSHLSAEVHEDILQTGTVELMPCAHDNTA